MVKFGALKKIAALTAAIAMVLSFAVCVGAADVQVSTTTQYVADTNNAKVNVIANVSGLGDAAYVTYYATNDTGVVYVDQEDVVDGEATFDYVTASENVLNSNVKVGYTAGTSAEDATIDGYKVTVNGANPVVIPTLPATQTVVLPYTVESGYEVTGVTAAGATAELISYDATSITVTISDVANSTIDITVATKALENVNASASYVAAAALVSTGRDTDAIYVDGEEVTGSARKEYEAAEGDRKLTVLAKVENSNAYGVIITKDTIETGAKASIDGIEGLYAAKGAGNGGYFAVQLIDTGDDVEGALIQSGVDYNVYVYYATSNGYMIIAGGVANTTSAAE